MEETEEIVIEEYYNGKSIKKLIFLVAFTAILLISTTYAWFSTQRNIVLSGLKGEVNVAEGLQMSLDAKHWLNTINFEDFLQTSATSWTVKSGVETTYLDAGKTFQNPAEGVTNIVPEEYLPVSTTGGVNEGIGKSGLVMYGGTYTDSEGLKGIDILPEEKESGYFAFDLYLMNTSKEEIVADDLQLDAISDVYGTNEATGIQNTVRVGIALYENGTIPEGEEEHPMKIGQTAELTQAEIIAGTSTGKKIIDLAIWEPNADKHVDTIVNSNSNKLKLTSADNTKYGLTANEAGISKFADGNMLPTYALTGASKTSGSISDVYDWKTPSAGLTKQVVTTTKDEIRTGSIDLYSVKDGTTPISIIANQYQKIRVYVWIEGQDPDCINYASLGQGLILNLGLSKKSSEENTETGETTTAETYLPTGFTQVEGTTVETGLTIQDRSGNQYVWVEVPKTTAVYQTAGLAILSFTDEEYTKIENDLHTYTSVYRDGTSWTDTWSSEEATGLTETEYYTLKKKMLKSVYQNGGFYVGKYETGIEGSSRFYGYTESDFITEHPITETPVVKQNAYVYDWVRCSQAQTLASRLNSGQYTTSLMFGVQWDLVLKHIETQMVKKGMNQSAVQALLKNDSTNYGNYYNSNYTITNSNAKYNAFTYSDEDDNDLGVTFAGYQSAPYTHTEDSEQGALLTTGASEAFNMVGIYDLAGNAIEWTLEKTSYSSHPCAVRGGLCGIDGDGIPASYRYVLNAEISNPAVGFRAALY